MIQMSKPYASPLDMLQYQLWALHLKAQQDDRRHRREINLNVKLNWNNTLAFIDQLQTERPIL